MYDGFGCDDCGVGIGGGDCVFGNCDCVGVVVEFGGVCLIVFGIGWVEVC